MKYISRHLYELLHNALRHAGTYEPEIVLSYVEEQLTAKEHGTLFPFLLWCHENGKTFGRGNYDERFKEWLAS